MWVCDDPTCTWHVEEGLSTLEDWIKNNQAVAAGEGHTDMDVVEAETRAAWEKAHPFINGVKITD